MEDRIMILTPAISSNISKTDIINIISEYEYSIKQYREEEIIIFHHQNTHYYLSQKNIDDMGLPIDVASCKRSLEVLVPTSSIKEGFRVFPGSLTAAKIKRDDYIPHIEGRNLISPNKHGLYFTTSKGLIYKLISEGYGNYIAVLSFDNITNPLIRLDGWDNCFSFREAYIKRIQRVDLKTLLYFYHCSTEKNLKLTDKALRILRS